MAKCLNLAVFCSGFSPETARRCACTFCLGALSEVSNGGFAYLSPAIAWKKEGVPKDSFMIALM